MPTRLLIACVVALATLVACTVAGWLSGPALAGWMTPVGLLAPGELGGAALAGLVGGLIARDGFRTPAVGLVLVVGLSGTVAAGFLSDYAPADATLWLMRHAFAPIVLACALAWIGAAVGERLARRHRPSPVGPA